MKAFHDELLRERADRHKPTFSRLRYEGVSLNAAIAIHAGRDALAENGWTAQEIVDVIEGTGAHPFTADDVPPMRAREIEEHTFPLHDEWDALAERALSDWDALEAELEQSQAAEVAAAVQGLGPRWDEADYDPTDAEQGQLERGWAESRTYSRTAVQR